MKRENTAGRTIAIASGKGGTGKTTFAVNLVYALAQREEERSVSGRREIRLLDCDVEEPNCHLFTNPVFTERKDVEALKPVWDSSKCIGCGKCAEACNYNAIAVVKGQVILFNELCHSCGVCAYVCPESALTETPVPIGIVEAAPENELFYFAHGLLNIGEALAPKVIGELKKHCSENALNILDAAPGTACSVVEAVGGTSAVILVTEPTPFGLHDLKLAVELMLKLRLPVAIVINRSDGVDKIIADYASEIGIPIAGRIPFKREYAETYSKGDVLIERFPELRENLLNIFDNLQTAAPPVPESQDFVPLSEAADPFKKGTAKDYKEVTVISGKGGTGKTTVVSSLAQLAEYSVLADNDVDAADLHLLIKPEVREAHDFTGSIKCTVNPDACIACGRCAELCHFDAIFPDGPGNGMADATYRIEELICEGCGLCVRVCPVNAISGFPNVTGKWYVSDTNYGPMVHARLGVAEENSGRLVAQVRNKAAELTRELSLEKLLGDGPPGTGCPVIASVTGTDLVVLVTEPTVSGVHDLERVMRLVAQFEVPAAVVINKYDLNLEQTALIEEMAEKKKAKILGRIPFDRSVNDSLMAVQTVVEYGDSPARRAIIEIYENLRSIL